VRVAQLAPQRLAAARYAALCLHGARWPVERSDEIYAQAGLTVGI